MKQVIECDKLLDLLPHGSGIDSDWSFSEFANGNVSAHNEFHKMDEYGYYCGYVPFTVRLYRHKRDVIKPLTGPCAGQVQIVHHKNELDFDLYCPDPTLRDYLADTIYFALEPLLGDTANVHTQGLNRI